MKVNNARNSNPLYVGPQIFFRPIPSYVDSLQLAVGSAESFTVPDTAGYVIFSATDDFYANANATATVPGDVADGSASELNPVGYTVQGGETISIVSSATTAIITMSVYDKPSS